MLVGHQMVTDPNLLNPADKFRVQGGSKLRSSNLVKSFFMILSPVKYGFISITLIFISMTVFLAHSPNAQSMDDMPAVELRFQCPNYTVSGLEPLTLNADILEIGRAHV